MKYLLSFILSLSLFSAYAQQEYPGAQPDLPGTLVVDFGFNFLQNAPEEMDLKIWGSRGVDIYYLYPVPFGDSKFSFHPGIGFGFEKYSFSGNVTVTDEDSTRIIELDEDVYQVVDKTQLATHYVDIPLEFRFYSKEDYRGVMVAIGAKIGRLIDSYTKIKFDQDGETKVDKYKREYNLNPWRYGAQARIGFRGFNLVGYYGFSDLFMKGEGPQTNNFKLGLSIALF